MSESRKGGLFLSPSNFGEKIEFITRACGEFKQGEVVVALSCIHDTKPENPRRGARFIRVRRLNSQDDISELVSSGKTITYKIVAGTEQDELVLDEVTCLKVEHLSWHECGPELGRKTKRVKKDGLAIQIDWEKPSIRLWIGSAQNPETFIRAPQEFAGEILEKVFGYNVATEQEKERLRLAEAEAKRVQEEVETRARWKLEEARRIALFFSVHPEAREWFSAPPTWENVGDEAIRRKLAVYSGQEKTGHYASFSKEMDFYSSFWELTLGDETFTISRSTVDHVYGDD
ncbi:MAG: hypothetical protein Q7S05_01345 [bacterium]|nr:hypothetical protein [bacterium]